MRTGIQSSHQKQQLWFRSLRSSSAFYLHSVQSLPTPCAILNQGRIMYFDATTTPAHAMVPLLSSNLESVLKHHPKGTQHRAAVSGSTACWRNRYPTSTLVKGSGCPAGRWQQEGPCAPPQPLSPAPRGFSRCSPGRQPLLGLSIPLHQHCAESIHQLVLEAY